ncbi:hypothetical protein FVP74_08370 [Microbacterium saccharophilum]|uniref:Uncharacterized protein n=1 Tax=Microbacterium saccharophilum TaxID=1213358 RepID=A0A5C8HYJ6_9MICO|nr:hypothetical protein [Microbacterium saccharophilum]TXK11346.1 hypothetical protein FVP74_08370 [Microbacterium saccharophilum]GEP48801.1 hypothetical protein MSA03_23090 [Microbacterium saccharophilum]
MSIERHWTSEEIAAVEIVAQREGLLIAWPGTVTSYGQIHEAMRREFGPAKRFGCGNPACSNMATDYALIGEYTHVTVHAGIVKRYAPDALLLWPLCRSCNGRLAGAGSWQTCSRGHDRAKTGTIATQCAECRRAMNRARDARRAAARAAATTLNEMEN